MHSIQDLNNYSDTTLSYTDERATSISFSSNTPANSEIETNASSTIQSVAGTDITEIIDWANLRVTYTFDISSVGSYVTANWPDILNLSGVGGSSFSNVAGKYVFANVSSVHDWDIIKDPILTISPSFTTGSFSYTGNIAYRLGNVQYTKTWTNTVTSSNSANYWTSVSNSSFNKNTLSTITNYPQIQPTAGDPDLTWRVDITPNTRAAITSMTSSGGIYSFNNVTKTLSLTGNMSMVNGMLANISYQPGLDYNGDFRFAYKMTIPLVSPPYAYRYQNIIKSNVEIVSNLSASRTFTKNQGAQTIFSANTPQITETVAGANYSLTVNTSAGRFGTTTSNYANSYTITGNLSSVNSQIAGIKFWPTKDVTGSQTYTLTLVRGTKTALTATANITGTGDATANATTLTFTTSQSWTPTYDQVNYYDNIQVLLVGAGGAGRGAGFTQTNVACTVGPFGGGGSGGQVLEYSNVALSEQAYTLTVGASGSNTRLLAANGSVIYSAAGGTTASSDAGANVTGHTGGTGNATIVNQGIYYIPTHRNWLGGANPQWPAAGGGGASYANNGENHWTTDLGWGGNGAVGVTSSITGNTYAGGGGGWGMNDVTTRVHGFGRNGGGNGGWGTLGNIYGGSHYYGDNGTINTGGGGGGGVNTPGNGGSGVIVVKFS